MKRKSLVGILCAAMMVSCTLPAADAVYGAQIPDLVQKEQAETVSDEANESVYDENAAYDMKKVSEELQDGGQPEDKAEVLVPAGKTSEKSAEVNTEEEIPALGQTYTLPVANGADISPALAQALKAGQTDITIPAGTYTMSSKVQLEGSNLAITANGANVTAASGDEVMLFTASDKSPSNIKITGGNWNGANKAGSAVFRFYNVTGLSVENVTVSGSKKAGVLFNNCKNVAVTNVTSTGNGEYGLNVSNGSVATVTGGAFNSNGKSGILVQEKGSLQISGSTLNSNKEKGLYVSDGSNATATQCTVDSNGDNGLTVNAATAALSKITAKKSGGAGVVFSNGASGSITGSTVSSNGEHGIIISDSSANLTMDAGANTVESNNWNGVSISGKSTKATITGGSYCNNGQKPKASEEGESGHGIGVFEGAQATIAGVTASNNKVCGLSPFGKGVNVTISDSILSNNGRHGIGARKYVTINATKCTIEGNAQHGIMVNDHSTASLNANTIDGSGKSGICIGDTSKGKAVNDNEISNSKEEGIYVYNSSSATIRGGSSSGNKKCGVTTDKKAEVTVSKLTVEKNKMYGFNIKGGKASITSCNIKNNKKSGIQVKDSAKVSKIKSNKILENGQYGIYVKGSTVSSIQKNTITDHSKYGIALYSKATSKKIKSNNLSNPKGKNEFYKDGNCSSNLKTTNVIKFDKIKKNAKKVTGKAFSKAKITIKAGEKQYEATAKSNGKFSVKTSKLKKGTEVSVFAKDAAKNTFSNTYTVK